MTLFFVRVYMEEAKLLKNLSYFPYKKRKGENLKRTVMQLRCIETRK